VDPRSSKYSLALLGALASTLAHADFNEALKEYQDGHYETAHAQFLVLAELGDAASQFNLGAMAMHGQNGPKDLGTAVGWLMAAADNGNRDLVEEKLADMQSKLTDEQHRTADGIASRYGRTGLLKTVLPVPNFQAHCTDLVPARVLKPREIPRWSRHGNQNGFVILQLTIGADGIARDPEVLLSLPNPEFSAPAVEFWMQMRFAPAEQGGQPVESKLPLKATYTVTGGGAPVWGGGALNTIRETALKGEPSAQYAIGLAAALDPSLKIPPAEAQQLLVSAAQGGHPQAQYWAANRFMSLESCDRQNKKLPWLRAAAASGDGAAQLALAIDLLKGQPSTAQVAQARSLLEQAAQSDNSYARKHVVALMASWPLDGIRDPVGAVVLAKKLIKDPIESDPQMFEAVAAAYAANGDFPGAAAKQEVAIKKASQLHWNTQLMQERLAHYHRSQSWVGDLFSLPLVTPSSPRR